MSRYRNGCTCERCRTRGLMGPAVLVTLGILLLLGEMHIVSFNYTWPVLLIVIGVVKVLQGNASLQGHVQYPYGQYAGYPVAPAAPPTAAGTQQTTSDPGQVTHG